MRSATLITITKMLESLPEDKQEQVLNHLYEYITDLMMKLDEVFYSKALKKNYPT